MQFIDGVTESISETFRQVVGSRQMDTRSISFLAVMLLSITAPLDLSQLTFAFIGALAYALLHSMHVSTAALTKRHVKDQPCMPPKTSAPAAPRVGTVRGRACPGQATTHEKTPSAATPAGAEFRKPSSQPVVKPTFKASGWDAEVQELVDTISPSAESEKIVAQMTKLVQRRLRAAIPDVEVTGFLTSDLHRRTAFGVAVPEVDIVASISPDLFAQCCAHKIGKEVLGDPKKLQKAAIRFCTNQLVGDGGFKFRRSAFKSTEPKVTLLASAGLCGSAEAIPIDFSVNSSMPLFNAALVTECGQLEPRARLLIMMVRRWAKDRGVCHAAKGHLSPYAWTLLVMYFLQSGTSPRLLPSLDGFKCSAHLTHRSGKDRTWQPPDEGDAKKTVGQLFKEFMAFYTKEFDFRKEAVSVRRGSRGPPSLSLPIHVVFGENGSSSQVAPSVEDPFEPSRNLSESCTSFTVGRLHEELARAEEICSRGGSLSELLEPWVPAERPDEDEL